MKSIKKLLLVTIVAILLCSMAVATVFATSDVKDEEKNTGIAIESKEKKVSSYKVTWNYNGGKIGSKKSKVTTVKKGSKIGKLAATPKRSGYAFKGWYTKKSGGKKITKNTKVTKKVTFFAQWTKTRKLNAEEKKLAGLYYYGSNVGGFLSTWTSGNFDYQQWNDPSSYSGAMYFKSDGTYEGHSLSYLNSRLKYIKSTANWKISSKGTYLLTNYVEEVRTTDGIDIYNYPGKTRDYKYVFTKKDGKNGMFAGIFYTDGTGWFWEKIK